MLAFFDVGLQVTSRRMSPSVGTGLFDCIYATTLLAFPLHAPHDFNAPR
jgi:hypothetical protein